MSKLDITTQDLLLRLGSTSHLRSARAEALFRRLRRDDEPNIGKTLSKAPRRLTIDDIMGRESQSRNPARTPKK